MSSLYDILEWDSRFFGIKIAKVNRFNSEDELSYILNEITQLQIKLLYFFVEPNDIFSNLLLKKLNANLVDEKLTYILDIKNIIVTENNQHVKPYWDNELTEELKRISIQTSEFSRFRVDKRIGDELCDKLYLEWINNAVNKVFNDSLYVYSENSTIEGLVSLKNMPNSGSISLIGVDNKSRGKNIGTLLIKKAIAHYLELGFSKLEVVTQKANIPACKFYEKNGFIIKSINNIYHLWI